MFTINTQLLRNMGWREYSHYKGLGVDIQIENYEDIKFFILFNDRKLCFVIKEISKKSQLQNSSNYNVYKFIKIDFSKKKRKFVIEDVNSNIELMKLIRSNLACNLTRQRFFQINSILK